MSKIGVVLSSLFLVVLTANLFPRIAGLAHRSEDLATYLSSCIRFMMFFSIPAVAYVSLFAGEVVGMLFGRGRLGVGDQIGVALVLAIVVVGVPLALLRDILNRACFALDLKTVPFCALAGAVAANIVLSALLSPTFGVLGIAWSLVLSLAANAAILCLIVRRRIGEFNAALVFAVAALYVATAGMLLIPSYFVDLRSLWWLLWLPYFGIYVIILRGLNNAEARHVLGVAHATVRGIIFRVQRRR